MNLFIIYPYYFSKIATKNDLINQVIFFLIPINILKVVYLFIIHLCQAANIKTVQSYNIYS